METIIIEHEREPDSDDEQTDDNGFVQVKIELPAKWTVCPDCRGEGVTLLGSLRDVAYTREDFDEDPDFEEDYFNSSSHLHETCRTCRGRTTVKVVDEDRLKHVKPEVLADYNRWLKSEDDRLADEAADRRTRYMESGGYGY